MSDITEETARASEEVLTSLGIDFSDIPAVDVDEDFAPIVVEQPTVVVASPPEFTVPRQVLTNAVEQVMQVIPTRDFIPALKNVVLDATPERLTVTGSDSTSTVICQTTSVRVMRPGRVLIGAKKFSDVIRRCDGGQVSLAVDDQMLRIESGSSSWSLRIAGVQDYVPLASLGDLDWHTLDREAFVAAVRACRFAAGSDENDPARMQLDIHRGVVTTTDKFCFAQVSGYLPSSLSCQISVAAVDLLLKMLDRNDAAEFRLADTPFHTVAEIGPASAPDRMVVAHITEPFPEEARNAVHVPLAENRDVLTIDGDALAEALRRAVPTADEETQAVALRVGTPEDGQLTVATRNRYGDLSSEVLAAPFERPGAEGSPQARMVLVSHQRLTQAVRAVGVARPESDSEEESLGIVRLLLGVDRSRARPAYVLVSDGVDPNAVRSIKCVLTQVRSDWIS